MKSTLISAVALIIAVIAIILAEKAKSQSKIGFVDTNRLMTGFSAAHKANAEVKIEDDKWKANLRVMEDSLKSFMDTMTVKFDSAPMSVRKELQDELATRNQQINNFSAVQTRKMEDFASKKMAGVYEKINAYMKEFGKANGYQIVFGTSNGSILYGEGSALDATDEVIKALNKRYE